MRSAPCRSRREEGGSAPTRGGFALVVTVSILVLLAVIAIGLLSLSTIAVRSASREDARVEARANARLALLMAVGELQKRLGPDQRISARAELLDTEPSTPEADGVANPHYLGAWDSWDTWLTDQKGPLSIQDTYRPGRDPSLFRGWLVSHPDADDYRLALDGVPTEDMVVLCGEGSAGADAANHVSAARIPVQTGGGGSGRYAWWVSDESQKARLNLEGRDEADSVEAAQALASHLGRPGVGKMEGMDGFDTSPEAIPRTITTGQARLSAPRAADRFHDITAHSLGLLTDVRSGGFKGDLNLAFESDRVPAEMDEATLFGGRPFDAPIRPMTGELGQVVPQNPYVAPMAWRQLREYYRVHRTMPGSDLHPITWERGTPQTRRFVRGDRSMQNKWDTGGYARQPVMLRQTWIVATQTVANASSPGGQDHYILAVPVVSLWNPYDIPLVVDSEEISYFGSMFYAAAMVQRTYRGSQYLGERPFPDETSWGGGRPNHDITANQLGYRMIPKVGRGSGAEIRFEPGEVRIFSTDEEILHGVRLIDSGDAMASRHFFASPGYLPIQGGGSRILRGLKNKVNPGTGQGQLSFSLRLAVATRTIDPFWVGASRKSTIAFSFQEALAASHGAYYDDGSLVGKQEWHDVVRLQAFSLDWLTERDVNSAWIVRDEPAARAVWPAPGSPPLPVGIFSVVAKSPEELAYGVRGSFALDYRNRNWLHAPPTGMGTFLANPTDLNRADCAYQLHFTPVNGDQEVSQWLQADGPNGYYGGGYTPGTGQTHVSALDLPLSPLVNLGAFAGVRMAPARARIDQRDDRYRSPSVDSSGLPGRGYHNLKHQAHRAAAFGPGIGNAYAHPMIEAEEVYTRNRFGEDRGWDGQNATNMAITDDHWDHLFLANEGLWDSWFCSGLVPEVRSGRVRTTARQVAEDFFSGEPTALPATLQPYLRGKSPEELAALVEESSASPGENGWDLIASHLLNRGQFNVNSPSKEAWKALLLTLSDRPLALQELGAAPSVLAPDPDGVTLSRFPLANSDKSGEGPLDEHSWRGIRTLSEAQIDKLAEEIVRQVKLRGPFLNMTDFINRRLTDDATGVTGALQAAIDWDEFNAGYEGTTSGAGASINEDYKDSGDMLTLRGLPADYPNKKAATGSRFAGIPGYVMQSDLLQNLGTSLTVRGDTFLIRAYGESLNGDGTIAAKAWCEAVVQRVPEFVDPADEADLKMRSADRLPGEVPDLEPLNEAFGRQFRITAFRWLNKDEV